MSIWTYATRGLGLSRASHQMQQSSHKNGEVMLVGPYASQGQGSSRASLKRHYHNHLMEVISWGNNACKDLCCSRPRAVEG